MRRPAVPLFIFSKSLINDRGRFLATATGVGLAVALIITLRGIVYGTLAQATVVVDKSPASLFIVQEGTTTLFRGVSILPKRTSEVIEAIPGVEKAIGVVWGVSTFTNKKGQPAYFFFNSLDLASPEGQKWKITQGRSWEQADEMVIDEVLAKKNDVVVGDQVQIRDTNFTIVGFSSEGTTPLGSFVFTSPKGAGKILRLQNVVGHFQVITKPGFDPGQVAEEIKKTVPDVEVFGRTEFRANHQELVRSTLLPSINVMSAISFFVGAVVIGLTLYNSVLEKKREFGIIKAIGASNSNIFQIVFLQAIIASFLGFWIGLGVTQAMLFLVSITTPEVSIILTPSLLFYIFIVANVMSVVAALIPVKLISRIDPAMVFK